MIRAYGTDGALNGRHADRTGGARRAAPPSSASSTPPWRSTRLARARAVRSRAAPRREDFDSARRAPPARCVRRPGAATSSPTPRRRSRSRCRATSASRPSRAAHWDRAAGEVVVYSHVGDVDAELPVVAAALLRLRRRRRARRRAGGLDGGGPAGLDGRSVVPGGRVRGAARGQRCWPRARTSRRSSAASPRAWSTRSSRASSAARARPPTAAPAASRAASTSPPPGRSTRTPARLRPASLPPGPLVFYCGGGISATVGVFAAALAGRDDARLYDGSLTEWTADPLAAASRSVRPALRAR